MEFRLFTQITKNIDSVTDGQLVASYLSLRDRMVSGEHPLVFLNQLFNLVSAELVRRAKREAEFETLLSCDLCHHTVSEYDGRWLHGDFVCGNCTPGAVRMWV